MELSIIWTAASFALPVWEFESLAFFGQTQWPWLDFGAYGTKPTICASLARHQTDDG
jgi:hypothetical protein